MFRHVVATRVAFVRGRLSTAIAVGEVIDPDAVDDVALRALALTTRGTALLASDRERSRTDCEEALALAELHGWPYLAVQAESTLALVDNYAGKGERTSARALRVLSRAGAHGWDGSSWTLRARFALATAGVLRGRPDDAFDHIRRAEVACPPGHAHFETALAVLRGAAEHDAGDALHGWQRIRRARLATPDDRREVHELAGAALLEQRAAMAVGRRREAAEVARDVGPRLEGTADLALLRARDQWAKGDPRARATLAPVLVAQVRALTALTVVDAPLLDAEIALARGELSTARDRLRRALDLAVRLDVHRPLRHAPDAVRRYLAEHRDGFDGLGPLIDDVVVGGAADPAAAEPLTDRERDVLELLPTQRSSGDIAEDLTVSVNTAKTHQRAIYQKLGVDNRREAVARARRLGLLVPPR